MSGSKSELAPGIARRSDGFLNAQRHEHPMVARGNRRPELASSLHRTAARGVELHIMHTIEQLLPYNPQIGRPGRVPGTRELVIPKTPFIVPYRLHRNVIQIIRVYHGARRWPESF